MPGAMAAGFRRFWVGEAVSGFGTAITLLALQTIVVLNLQGTALQVGWLSSARWLPYLVLGLIVGALVERVRRRPVMIATDLCRAGLLTLIPISWGLGLLTFPLLLVIAVLFGTATLVNNAASMSFVPRLVPRDQLQRAHARLDGADAVAQTAGPAVAGALIRVVGAPLAVLVDAFSFLVSAFAVASLRDISDPAPANPSKIGVRRLAGEIGEGIRWVYGRSGLARLAVATHIWFVAQAVLLVVITPYAYLQLQLSPFGLGLVFAVAGVGALMGATTSTALGDRLGTGGAIICCHMVSAVGAVIMVAAMLAPIGWPGAVVLAAGQFCHGWAMGTSNSHETGYRQAITPDELQARTNTTMRSLNRAVFVVVSPLAGLLADAVGFGPTLVAAAAVFATSAVTLAASPFRRVRMF